jgi:hypothetical protein
MPLVRGPEVGAAPMTALPCTMVKVTVPSLTGPASLLTCAVSVTSCMLVLKAVVALLTVVVVAAASTVRVCVVSELEEVAGAVAVHGLEDVHACR